MKDPNAQTIINTELVNEIRQRKNTSTLPLAELSEQEQIAMGNNAVCNFCHRPLANPCNHPYSTTIPNFELINTVTSKSQQPSDLGKLLARLNLLNMIIWLTSSVSKVLTYVSEFIYDKLKNK